MRISDNIQDRCGFNFPRLGQPYKAEGQWYADDQVTGERFFVPNRCCKCAATTHSQNDRFCDDCFAAASWNEKYKPYQLVFFMIGLFALMRMILSEML